MVWRSFAALADSFTEGMDDRYPDGRGYRGWADLVAGALAIVAAGESRYANLAVRGRLFDRVVDEQVPAAVRMRPDLVSFAAGGNDVLRWSFDPARLGHRLDGAVAAMRAAGSEVVLFQWSGRGVGLPGARSWCRGWPSTTGTSPRSPRSTARTWST